MSDAALPVPPISGRTTLIAHLGFPTDSFKAPMIYNPWFAASGIDAVVVPMGVRPQDYAAFLPLVGHGDRARPAGLLHQKERCPVVLIAVHVASMLKSGIHRAAFRAPAARVNEAGVTAACVLGFVQVTVIVAGKVNAAVLVREPRFAVHAAVRAALLILTMNLDALPGGL